MSRDDRLSMPRLSDPHCPNPLCSSSAQTGFKGVGSALGDLFRLKVFRQNFQFLQIILNPRLKGSSRQTIPGYTAHPSNLGTSPDAIGP
jgi:hypothetical protein